jgi:hypothetical protein
MLTRDDILRAYGVPDLEGAQAEGAQVRVCFANGGIGYLQRAEAEKLAAELLLIGAIDDADEIGLAVDAIGGGRSALP